MFEGFFSSGCYVTLLSELREESGAQSEEVILNINICSAWRVLSLKGKPEHGHKALLRWWSTTVTCSLQDWDSQSQLHVAGLLFPTGWIYVFFSHKQFQPFIEKQGNWKNYIKEWLRGCLSYYRPTTQTVTISWGEFYLCGYDECLHPHCGTQWTQKTMKMYEGCQGFVSFSAKKISPISYTAFYHFSCSSTVSA